MAVLDLLGRRWTLRVLWELHQRPLPFRELQAACDGMSSSVLSTRLGELTHAGVVETGADGAYRLSTRGRELMRRLAPLESWAEGWARELR